MNKFIFLFVLSLISITIVAQRSTDALLLMKGSSDTLEVEIINKNPLFPKDSFDLKCLHKNIVIVGEKRDVWIKARDIDYISLTDYKGNQREFISIELAPELKQIDSVNKKLYEVICKGRIRWYREYYPSAFGNMVKAGNYLFKDNKKPVSINAFTNEKNKLLRITEDMPELKPKIQGMKTYEDMLEIIMIYNNN